MAGQSDHIHVPFFGKPVPVFLHNVRKRLAFSKFNNGTVQLFPYRIIDSAAQAALVRIPIPGSP